MIKHQLIHQHHIIWEGILMDSFAEFWWQLATLALRHHLQRIPRRCPRRLRHRATAFQANGPWWLPIFRHGSRHQPASPRNENKDDNEKEWKECRYLWYLWSLDVFNDVYTSPSQTDLSSWGFMPKIGNKQNAKRLPHPMKLACFGIQHLHAG